MSTKGTLIFFYILVSYITRLLNSLSLFFNFVGNYLSFYLLQVIVLDFPVHWYTPYFVTFSNCID